MAKEEPGAAPDDDASASANPTPTAIEDTQGAKPVTPTSEEPLQLGRSFANATPVKPGSFVTDMVPGDVRLLKIPVQEGQRLRYRAESAETESRSYDVGEWPEFSMNFFNPLRMPVRFDGVSRSATFNVDSDSSLEGGLPSATRVSNRDIDTSATGSSDDEIAENWLGGDQYIMLHLSRATGAKKSEKNEPVRVQVTLEVDGQAGQGVKLETSHAAPTNAPVNDQGKPVAGDSTGLLPTRLGRAPLLVGAGVAALVAIGAAVAATVLIRRRH